MEQRASASDPLDAPQVTSAELLAEMPHSMRRAFPPFIWTEAALWRLDLPVVEQAVESFDWLLDLPIWRWQGRRFQLSLQDVLSNPEQFQAHIDKAERADMTYPIHVVWHRHRWVILDGYHRLLKTLMHGGHTIKAMRVRAGDLASEAIEQPSWPL